MFYIIAFIILSTAVVLHEFGHYIVAKLLRMRVETFSVGFGPRIWGTRWGTTDYRLSLIPLGGYVKLGGDESNAPIEGAGESSVPEAERFDLRPRWQKFLVMIAGPTMNILTALTVVAGGAILNGVPQPLTAPVVSTVAQGGNAEASGVRPGDRIKSFNGIDNPTWERIANDALLSPEQPLPMLVERGGERVQLTVKPTKLMEDGQAAGLLDFRPDYGDQPVRVVDLVAGAPGAQAGLRVGDRILQINGEPVGDEQEVRTTIQRHKGEPIRVLVERAGARQELTADTSRTGDGKLGVITAVEVPQQRVGPVAAVGYAMSRNLEVLRMTGAAFAQIFKGQRSARESLSGPIGIATASAKAVENYGLAGALGMLGFLSLNLGVVNLLPIPVLDGGAIFLLFIEAMLGWVGLGLSMAVRERIQQVGFVVLMLLMGFVITNDFFKIASRLRAPSDAPPAATRTK